MAKQKESASSKQARVKKGWKLLDNANMLAPFGSSLQKCGLVPRATNVTIVEGEHGLRYSGLKQCKSAWSCPRCTPSKMAKRAAIFKVVHRDIISKGSYKPVMMTYTIQHKQGESLKELLDIVRSCYRYIFSGSRGRRFLKVSLGYISSLEITHGANGWHPHFHVLFYLKTSVTDSQINEWLIDPYTRQLKLTGKLVRDVTVKKQEWRGDSDYITKGSAISELTGSANKKSRNIMDILSYSRRGNKWHKLYLEYIEATHRVKAINTSSRISEMYKIAEYDFEKKEKVKEDSSHIVSTLTRDQWSSIIKTGTRYEVLVSIQESLKKPA